ncbi:hypothetical protein H100_00698 [Trichophyton rubrum MR850]|nr:hypothetical protein H100_00698 [Trichophyton rubrum MR850]
MDLSEADDAHSWRQIAFIPYTRTHKVSSEAVSVFKTQDKLKEALEQCKPRQPLAPLAVYGQNSASEQAIYILSEPDFMAISHSGFRGDSLCSTRGQSWKTSMQPCSTSEGS